MTRIQNPGAPSSQPLTKNRDDGKPDPATRQPSIQRQNAQQVNDAAREDPVLSGPQGFIDKAAVSANATRIAINAPRLTAGTLVSVTKVSAQAGVNVRPDITAMAGHYNKLNLEAKLLELPLRTLTTLKDINNGDTADGALSGTKLIAHTTELVADTVAAMKPAVVKPAIPFERGHILRTAVGAPTEPTDPLQPAFVRGGEGRVPVRRKSTPPPRIAEPAKPAIPFERGHILRTAVGAPTVPTDPSRPAFVRGGEGRVPVRLKPSAPPRIAAPNVHSPGTPASGASSTLSRIGSSAGIVSGGIDIYFGWKQVRDEPDPIGKGQGALSVLSGVTSVGASGAGLMSTFGIRGAAALVPGLTLASVAAGAIATSMAAIPSIHARDNKNRATKLYNDITHEMKQMDEADKQLFQRANVQLKPTLGELEKRYGIQTGTVWLNNNAADFLNQVNTPNNTTSGQWKPDAEGNVWSNFRGSYIRIEGTPHQLTVELDLPAEKKGSPTLPASPEPAVKASGDNADTKPPVELKSLAADPARYQDEGWSASTGQPVMTKQYGYKTSSWGSNWDTTVPLSVNAGPLYLAHAVSNDGQDTVVLIDDTRVKRPDMPLPERKYTEGALFGLDGKDTERLSARQVTTLLFEDTPATVNDRFNVEASVWKAEENAYREAVYPMQEGTCYIRSPDAFVREITTHPEHRTVVSLQHASNPVYIVMNNERDIVDLPRVPRTGVTISLPRLPAHTVDQRRLGMPDQQERPKLAGKTRVTGVDGRSTIFFNTYTFKNGSTLNVMADDLPRIEQFVNTWNSRLGKR